MAYSGRSGGSGKRRPGSGGGSSRGGSARGDKSFGRKTTGGRSSRDDDRPAFKKKSFDKPFGDRRRRDESDEKPRFSGSRSSSGSSSGSKKSFGDKPFGDRRRRDDDRPGFKKKSFDKPFGDRRRRDESDEKPRFSGSRSGSSSGSKKSFGDKPFSDRRRRDEGDEKPRFSGSRSGSSVGSKKSFGDKPFADRRRRDDDRPAFKKKSFDKPFGTRKRSDRDDNKKFSGGGQARAGRPSWKKGPKDSDRGERSFGSKKRYEDKRGQSEWETFDTAEEASSFVKKQSPGRTSARAERPGKSHRGQEPESGDGTIRLNKYIANTGLCSRREADEMIEAGVIKVNGKIVTQLGTKIGSDDVVHYGDQLLRRENLVYVLLNKPKDYITTTDDPQERKTVLDLVAGAGTERIYPVGRLDRNTTGVLLLTNDGDLAERLMHPKYGVEKIYQVSLDMNLRKEDFDKIMEGIELEDGFIKADDMSFVGDGTDHKEVGIMLHSGRNRVVRRMFEHLGYTVKALDRVGYAGLTKKNVPKGKWRFLEPREVGFLKMKVGGEKQRRPKS